MVKIYKLENKDRNEILEKLELILFLLMGIILQTLLFGLIIVVLFVMSIITTFILATDFIFEKARPIVLSIKQFIR